MDIDSNSFWLGVIVALVAVWILGFITLPVRVWIRAFLSGAQVSLPTIFFMRLRGNPAALLVDAHITLRNCGVDATIQEVEVVYLQNRARASTPDALAEFVREYLEKKQDR